jgi:hypothetical protein
MTCVRAIAGTRLNATSADVVQTRQASMTIPIVPSVCVKQAEEAVEIDWCKPTVSTATARTSILKESDDIADIINSFRCDNNVEQIHECELCAQHFTQFDLLTHRCAAVAQSLQMDDALTRHFVCETCQKRFKKVLVLMCFVRMHDSVGGASDSSHDSAHGRDAVRVRSVRRCISGVVHTHRTPATTYTRTTVRL